MKIVPKLYLLLAAALAVACESLAGPGVRTVGDADLAIEYATVGGQRAATEPDAHHLRIAFDGYATYDERYASGEVNMLRTAELGAAGIGRLDSLFDAQRFLALVIQPDSEYCLSEGGVSIITYRPTADASLHSLTDTGCTQVLPAGFIIIRYALLGLIEHSLSEL